MIERFTEVQGNTLKIYYTLSTWNPYAVVEMESDFQITQERSSHVAASLGPMAELVQE
jgi:hypothetical protein